MLGAITIFESYILNSMSREHFQLLYKGTLNFLGVLENIIAPLNIDQNPIQRRIVVLREQLELAKQTNDASALLWVARQTEELAENVKLLSDLQ